MTNKIGSLSSIDHDIWHRQRENKTTLSTNFIFGFWWFTIIDRLIRLVYFFFSNLYLEKKRPIKVMWITIEKKVCTRITRLEKIRVYSFDHVSIFARDRRVFQGNEEIICENNQQRKIHRMKSLKNCQTSIIFLIIPTGRNIQQFLPSS